MEEEKQNHRHFKFGPYPLQTERQIYLQLNLKKKKKIYNEKLQTYKDKLTH